MAGQRLMQFDELNWFAGADADPKLSDEDRCTKMMAAARLVFGLPSENYRRLMDLMNVRLYTGQPLQTLSEFATCFGTISGTNQQGGFISNTPTETSEWNVARSAIDTLTAGVASTDVRARWLTVKGSYQEQRRAEDLQLFSDGLAADLELARVKPRAFLDACVFESGVGVVQLYRDGDRVRIQRLLPAELAIDPADGWVDGDPRTIYRRRVEHRPVATALFGDTEERRQMIADAPAVAVSVNGNASDRVELFEAWHLPSGDDADDGWHLVAVDSALDKCLVCEPHARKRHDIVFLRLETSLVSAWGLPLMSLIRPLQVQVNVATYRINRIFQFYSQPHIYLNRAAKINKERMSNDLTRVWEGTGPAGAAVQVLSFGDAAISAKLLEEREQNKERIFEVCGINKNQAEATHDMGVDASGEALREARQNSDQRSALRQQRYEQFHLDIIETAVGLVRDIAGEKRKRRAKSVYRVTSQGRGQLREIDWRAVAVDEDAYRLDIAPASVTAIQPDGLAAYAEDMLTKGKWTLDEYRAAIATLDDAQADAVSDAERDMMVKTFTSLLYDKVAAASPDEFTNTKLALYLGPKFLALGQNAGCPDKHVDRLRRYLKACVQGPPLASPPAPMATGVPPPPQIVPANGAPVVPIRAMS